ncbi:hypothetical protein ACQ4PT_018088 [Festuca glaucescens]
MADGGLPIPVHRCIIAALSPFFYDLVRGSRGDGLLLSALPGGGGGGGEGTGRPRYKVEELVSGGRVGREAFLEFMRTSTRASSGPRRTTWCPVLIMRARTTPARRPSGSPSSSCMPREPSRSLISSRCSSDGFLTLLTRL